MRFKIFTVTKNEYDLIEDFILYYGSQFGFDSLVIIDNGSDNAKVLQIYKEYRMKGVTIAVELGYEQAKQGEHFTKYMNLYKGSSDWLIGLDTDEFLVYNEQGQYQTRHLKSYFESFLGNLNPSCDIVCFNQFWSYCSPGIIQTVRPTVEIREFDSNGIPDGIRKRIFRSSNFIWTGPGNHTGETLNNKEFKVDSKQAVYLHYHNTGFKRQIERARSICVAYNYIGVFDEDMTIYNTFCKNQYCNGHHRVDQLRQFLHRKIIVDIFLKLMKRLPGEQEISSYWNYPIEQVGIEIRKRLDVESTPDYSCLSVNNYEQLLYTNRNSQHGQIIKIDAVANFFASL